jgi:branched-chain amino acid aminotransferase
MGESKAGKFSGAKCKVSSWIKIDSRSQPMQAKAAANYSNAALARIEALENGYDEAIMLNYSGKVSEGSAENIFIIKDNIIQTPPLSAGLLEGITRDSIIQIIEENGGFVIERDLERDDLYAADEIFMTGTAAEVKSVTQVDKVKIGNGKMGNITKALQKSFTKAVMGKDDRFLPWLTFI